MPINRHSILDPAPHAKHRHYGYAPDTLLRQCSAGFTWNSTLHGSETMPVEVRVVKEYEAHILVRAKFKSGESYTESINKCAVRGGYCYFLAVPEGV